jgi:hypothetical protein
MTAAIHPNNSTKESTTFANAFTENHAALVSRRFPVITAAVFEVKMKRSACSMLLITLVGGGCTVSRATDKTPTANESREGRSSSMSNESAMRDLFDRWERVWHEGQYDLIPSCVGPTYIRHDEKSDRTVTREPMRRQEESHFCSYWMRLRRIPAAGRGHGNFSGGSAVFQTFDASRKRSHTETAKRSRPLCL